MKSSLNEQRLAPLFEQKEILRRLRKDGSYTKQYRDLLSKIISEVHSQIGEALNHYPALWPRVDHDEASSIVQKSLLTAIDNFMPSRRKKCKFSSYLWSIIKRNFGNYLVGQRSNKRKGESVPLEEAEHVFYMDDDIHHRVILSHIKDNLGGDDRNLVEMLEKGYNLVQIGEALGVSNQAIRNRLDKIAKRFSGLKDQI